jgi:hypothetical protein
VAEDSQDKLKWALGIGIVVLGGLWVYQESKKPAPVAYTEPAPKSTASAAASTVGDPLPLVGGGPGAAGAKGSKPTGNPEGALIKLAEQLAAIAADPTKYKPLASERDPNGLILYVYELQGLNRPILAVVEGKPEAWAWQFNGPIPPAALAEGGKIEPYADAPEGVEAMKILAGPLAGSVVMTPPEQPKIRVIRSEAFLAYEKTAAGGPAGSASGGKPAPSGSGPGGRKVH